MRSRNIKPGFFKNEYLAECEPLTRILFTGLWCMADREGRLEYRPIRIKAEILPYDNCDIISLLKQLQERNFINIYPHDNPQYIEVINFSKHQHCHMKEQPSTIPAPDKHGASTVQKRPYTESPILKAESPIPESGACTVQEPDNPGNGSKPAFLENLKGTIERVHVKYTDPHIQRQVMLFVENNIRNHPGAIMHCLESLLKAPGEIKAPRAYLEAAMKIENGKHNARDSEIACNEFKKLPTNMSSFADIFKGMVKNG
jgi:hypothetical protein